MEMTVRQEERCLEIALIGELDHHAAREIGGRLDRAIEAALPLRLVLDWSGVTFMDSSGIAVVMRVRQRVRGPGRRRDAAGREAPGEEGAGRRGPGPLCHRGIERRYIR